MIGDKGEGALTMALGDLAAAGIHVTKTPEPWLELYEAPGYPELTRNQVLTLAARYHLRGPSFPSPPRV